MEEIDNDVYDFIVYFFNKFINTYTNSFLHLSFFELFKVLYKFETSFCLFISKNDIMNVLLDKLDNRYKINACFWGQINGMISYINVLVKKGKLETTERWTKYIDGVFAQRNAIIEKKDEEATKLISDNIICYLPFKCDAEEEEESSSSSDLESEDDEMDFEEEEED